MLNRKLCFFYITNIFHIMKLLFKQYCFSLEMCLEKRVFYRVISGLHASINTHLSAQYLFKGKLTELII